uniref:Lcl domain-containing protein n=1 Tax=Paraglaciecola marina TaxID=2500157 RepID=UPI00105F3287
FVSPTVTTNEVIEFTITVTDNDAAIFVDTINITVLPVNDLPTVSTGVDQLVEENTEVALTSLANDVDGTVTSYSWVQSSGNAVDIVNSNQSIATFNSGQVDDEETLSFVVTVIDNEGGTSSDSIQISIANNDLEPYSELQNAISVYENFPVIFNALATDDSDSALSFFWDLSDSSIEVTGKDSQSLGFTSPNVEVETSINVSLEVEDILEQVSLFSSTLTIQPLNLSLHKVNLELNSEGLEDVFFDPNTSNYLTYQVSNSGTANEIYFGNADSQNKLSLTDNDLIEYLYLGDSNVTIYFNDYIGSTVVLSVEDVSGNVLGTATIDFKQVTLESALSLVEKVKSNIATGGSSDITWRTNTKLASNLINFVSCLITIESSIGSYNVNDDVSETMCESSLIQTLNYIDVEQTWGAIDTQAITNLGCNTAQAYNCLMTLSGLIQELIISESNYASMAVINSPISTMSYEQNSSIDFNVDIENSYGNISAITWDFGDETSNTNQFVSKEYTDVGQYTATVSIELDSGILTFAEIEIMVTEQQQVILGALNDTGLTIEYLADDDSNYGRDALNAANNLAKIGAGREGFDFTKLDVNGDELDDSATDWACTKDNTTGLIWEVKASDGGLRDRSHRYTWFSSEVNSNGGVSGTENGGLCFDTLNCDTEKYVTEVNATGLCGASDWTIPSLPQLQSLIHFETSSPALDNNYFGSLQGAGLTYFYWSSTTNPSDVSEALAMLVAYGSDTLDSKSASHYLILVRSE